MRAKAYIKIITAMLLWGSLGIFVRMINIPSSEIVLFRVIIGGIFLLFVYLCGGKRSSGAAMRKAAPLLLVSGICMGLNWLFLFKAYRFTTVSLATVAYYCAPFIVTLLSPLLLKEKIAPLRLAGIFACLTGLVLIVGSIKADDATLKGFGLGLISACFYASVTLMNKFAKNISGLEITLIQLLGAFAVMLPYCLISEGTIYFPKGAKGITALLILGIVHSGIALFLYFSSLKDLPAQSAALCSFVDPGSALIFSALILDEKMTVAQSAAAVLILGGALFGEVFSPGVRARRRRKKQQ